MYCEVNWFEHLRVDSGPVRHDFDLGVDRRAAETCGDRQFSASPFRHNNQIEPHLIQLGAIERVENDSSDALVVRGKIKVCGELGRVGFGSQSHPFRK